MKRRWLIAAIILILAASITLALSPKTVPRDASALRNLTESRGIKIGTAVAVQPLLEDAKYRQVLGREFNLLSSENAMKFGPLSPRRGAYNFTDADELVKFAKANDMDVHAHVLVWHNQLPQWLTEGKFNREELTAILKEHIQKVVGHFRGKVDSWDVVNEAIADDGSLRNSIWLQVIGPGYIEMAFQWAREADPKAHLFYNDYGGEGMNFKSNAIYNLVKSFKTRGIPLDGVGLQMHLGLGLGTMPPSDVRNNINRLGQLGLEVHISEMDVQIQRAFGTEAEKLAEQAKIYGNMLAACLSTKACKTFTVWGLTDKHSWIPGHTGNADAPLLFDDLYRPKPAYNALVEVLKKR